MGKIKRGILGPVQGRVGSGYGSDFQGINRYSKMPRLTNHPPSISQQHVRNAFLFATLWPPFIGYEFLKNAFIDKANKLSWWNLYLQFNMPEWIKRSKGLPYVNYLSGNELNAPAFDYVYLNRTTLELTVIMSQWNHGFPNYDKYLYTSSVQTPSSANFHTVKDIPVSIGVPVKIPYPWIDGFYSFTRVNHFFKSLDKTKTSRTTSFGKTYP